MLYVPGGNISIVLRYIESEWNCRNTLTACPDSRNVNCELNPGVIIIPARPNEVTKCPWGESGTKARSALNAQRAARRVSAANHPVTH